MDVLALASKRGTLEKEISDAGRSTESSVATGNPNASASGGSPDCQPSVQLDPLPRVVNPPHLRTRPASTRRDAAEVGAATGRADARPFIEEVAIARERPPEAERRTVDHLSDLLPEILLMIASYLDSGALLALSGSNKLMMNRLADLRENLKKSANFYSEKIFTRDQIEYAKALLDHDIALFQALKISMERLLRQPPLKAAFVPDKHAVLERAARANGYPPLRHWVTRDGQLTPAAGQVTGRSGWSSLAAGLSNTLSALADYARPYAGGGDSSAENRHAKEPFRHSDAIWQTATNRAASGESLSRIADRFGLCRGDLFLETCEAIGAGRVEASASLDLHSMDLWNMNVAAITRFADALGRYPALSELNLSGNWIGAFQAKRLSGVLLQDKTLRHLDLSINALGNAGIDELADALAAHPALSELNLTWNEIGADGGRRLSDMLQRSRTLRTLDLSNNELGDDAALELARAAAEHPTLTTLNLHDAGVSDGMKQEIARLAEQSGKTILV
jgi:hypothetical protein